MKKKMLVVLLVLTCVAAGLTATASSRCGVWLGHTGFCTADIIAIQGSTRTSYSSHTVWTFLVIPRICSKTTTTTFFMHLCRNGHDHGNSQRTVTTHSIC